MYSGGYASLIALLLTVGLLVFFAYTYFPAPKKEGEGPTRSFKLIDEARDIKGALEVRDAKIQEDAF